ncbi:caspase, EACC1-associated type, partial [Nonomuraea fuscirosea]|uniref:caspase, EACC1-associated type n=1 Tax=Nonomuraea fuscirosea TaxID=1291556 RepID=UPI0034866A7A
MLLAAPGARVLLVGSGQHLTDSRLGDIPAVETTLADLGRVFVDKARLDPAHLTTLLHPADPPTLGTALVTAARQADDVLVVYYVGHGLIGPGQELHLATRATTDLTQGIASHQALPYSAVAEALRECPARLVVVVLDCCYAGRASSLARTAIDNVFSLTGPGSYVLAASGADQAAWAPPGEPLTAFSAALIGLLTTGDPLAPPQLTLQDVYTSVGRSLSARGWPEPRRYATDRMGSRMLAANPAHGESAGNRPTTVVPYRGLSTFTPEDADFFFGRNELIELLLDRVARQLTSAEPLLVSGPSGVGKSSLLRAGLMAALLRSRRTKVTLFTPGGDPVATVAARFAELDGREPGDLKQRLLQDPTYLAEVLARVGARERVVIVDQFEEVFTLAAKEPRRVFLQALQAASQVAVVVIGLRADFIGRCMAEPALESAVRRMIPVFPLQPEQLRLVIEEPARRVGATLEPGLVDLLIQDVGGDIAAAGAGGVLPLLSHALLQTWQIGTGMAIIVNDYLATGRVAGGLQRTAESVMSELSLSGRAAARRVLPRLVRIGEASGQGATDTRKPVPLSELLPPDGHPERAAIDEVLDRFAGARLLTVTEDMVEISHESLIRAWPGLRTWVDEDRATLLALQKLTRQADEWISHGEKPEDLLLGAQLSAAQQAQRDMAADAGRFLPVPEPAQRLLDASIGQQTQARRRARRIRATVVASLVVALLASIYITVNQVGIARQAEQRRLSALADQVAADSESLRVRDPVRSRLLAQAAFALDPDSTAARFQVAAAALDPLQRSFDNGAPPGEICVGHLDGKPVIASAGRGGVVKVWDLSGPSEQPLRTLAHATGPGAGVYSVAFGDLGGKPVIASAGRGGVVKVWDLSRRSEQPPRTLAHATGPGADVSSVAFGDLDGKPVIASAGSDGLVKV